MPELDRPRIGLNAHLLNLSGSYRSAGINWYIYRLIQALPTVGADFDFTVFSSEPRAQEQFKDVRLIRSRWPTHRPIIRILWEQLVQPLQLRTARIDLLHAMAFAGPLALSTPWVVTVYDVSFLLFPGSFNRTNRMYLTWAVRNALQRADRVIAISESTRRDLLRLFSVSPDKVKVVYCGRDAGFSPPTDRAAVERVRARRHLPERMILFVGTLEPRKNVPRLVRAFARAKREAHLAHRLVLVGARGWRYGEVDQAIAEEGIAGDVILAGYIPQDELPAWYQAADLFVYPSLYEGFGLPPLAAMACGTPVVASNASALPEVIGDAGLLVSPTDTNALTEAIIRGVTDSAWRQETSARGLKQAALFSWNRAARETTDIYRTVLGRNRVMTPSMRTDFSSHQNDSGAANASS